VSVCACKEVLSGLRAFCSDGVVLQECAASVLIGTQQPISRFFLHN
jgi:hypothetical protein